jgi:hypothetical protein
MNGLGFSFHEPFFTTGTIHMHPHSAEYRAHNPTSWLIEYLHAELVNMVTEALEARTFGNGGSQSSPK